MWYPSTWYYHMASCVYFSQRWGQPIGKGWGTVLISAQTLGWLMFIWKLTPWNRIIRCNRVIVATNKPVCRYFIYSIEVFLISTYSTPRFEDIIVTVIHPFKANGSNTLKAPPACPSFENGPVWKLSQECSHLKFVWELCTMSDKGDNSQAIDKIILFATAGVVYYFSAYQGMIVGGA